VSYNRKIAKSSIMLNNFRFHFLKCILSSSSDGPFELAGTIFLCQIRCSKLSSETCSTKEHLREKKIKINEMATSEKGMKSQTRSYFRGVSFLIISEGEDILESLVSIIFFDDNFDFMKLSKRERITNGIRRIRIGNNTNKVKRKLK
jgi:hypothetical protein